MRRSRPSRIRTRGSTPLMVVLVGSLVMGTLILASAARLAPAEREAKRTRTSDEALALAEAGILLARAELAKDPAYAGCTAMPLGEGEVSVVILRTDQGVKVTSRGKLARTARTRNTVVRVVEAQLNERVDGLPLVLTWKVR